MKNLETILKDAGVEIAEDVLKSVLKEHAENYKTIAEYTKQADKIKSLEDSVKETKDTLVKAQEDLKAFEGVDTEGLNKKIKELQATIDLNKADYEKKIADRDFNDILDKSIASAKGVNAKAIKALLDVDTLKVSKNQEKDIADAIKSLAEAEDSKMLFNREEVIGKGDPIGVVRKGGPNNELASMREAMGLPPIKEGE